MGLTSDGNYLSAVSPTFDCGVSITSSRTRQDSGSGRSEINVENQLYLDILNFIDTGEIPKQQKLSISSKNSSTSGIGTRKLESICNSLVNLNDDLIDGLSVS